MEKKIKKEYIFRIAKNYVGKYDQYCDGYNSIYNNYVCAVVLSTSKVQKKFYHKGSVVLDEINAFDKAEASGPYVGQINMVTASSFCGPMGVIWGYDLCKAINFKEDKIMEIDGVKVYDCKSLVKASELLFGTGKEKHFPLIPGAHVLCANKSITKEGPASIYCGIGIGVPENREKTAIVFMEDIGTIQKELEKQHVLELLAKSILKIGKNQNVKYKEIFVSMKDIKVEKREVGCALVAVPYIVLAKKAIPEDFTELPGMQLLEWGKKSKRNFLQCFN